MGEYPVTNHSPVSEGEVIMVEFEVFEEELESSFLEVYSMTEEEIINDVFEESGEEIEATRFDLEIANSGFSGEQRFMDDEGNQLLSIEEQRFKDELENADEMLREELIESGLTLHEYYERLDQQAEDRYINDMIRADCSDVVEYLVDKIVNQIEEEIECVLVEEIQKRKFDDDVIGGDVGVQSKKMKN